MCLIDRFEKQGIDIQTGLTPFKLQDESKDQNGGANDADIPFTNLTVDKSVMGQFETVVSWGKVTSATQIQPQLGLLKVGVEIAMPNNPQKTDKYVALYKFNDQTMAVEEPDKPIFKFKTDTQ